MIALNVTLLLDVDSEDQAFDAMNEILREQQRSFASSSCLIDYAVKGDPVDAGPLPSGYEEGDYFGTSNTGASHGVYDFPGGPEAVVGVPADQEQAIAIATAPKGATGRRGGFSTMRPLSEIMAERQPLDRPEQIAQRLSDRQVEALEKLAERPWGYLAASVLKVPGTTLMSLNDFERGKRDILSPLVLVTWDRSEPTGGRVWSITEFGLEVLAAYRRFKAAA